jgi:hypothetical protein
MDMAARANNPWKLMNSKAWEMVEVQAFIWIPMLIWHGSLSDDAMEALEDLESNRKTMLNAQITLLSTMPSPESTSLNAGRTWPIL